MNMHKTGTDNHTYRIINTYISIKYQIYYHNSNFTFYQQDLHHMLLFLSHHFHGQPLDLGGPKLGRIMSLKSCKA